MVITKYTRFKSSVVTMLIILLLSSTGCDNPTDNHTDNRKDADIALNQTSTESIENTSDQQDMQTTDPKLVPKDPSATAMMVDWSKIDSGETAASLEGYDYPIALDSDPVKAFAEYQGISLKQAQHNLTLGTASNEPLLALFDELGDNYVSHSLSDGADTALVVRTTEQVTPSQHNYVIANDFGKGLILPIIITPEDTDKNK